MTDLSISSFTSSLSVDSFYGQPNSSGFPDDNASGDTYDDTGIFQLIILIVILVIFIFGLVGNAITIWFLGFVIKKNPITTYILNLAIADFGVLISLFFCCLVMLLDYFPVISIYLLYFTYICSQYFLTAISIEKCLSVTFPLWYRCHRPKCLSPIVCLVIWIVVTLLTGMECFLYEITSMEPLIMSKIIRIVNFFVCTPFVFISTLILLLKVCCSLHRSQQGKLYTAILCARLFFQIFGAPFSLVIIFFAFESEISEIVVCIVVLYASINSSINPMIYILIGMKKMRRSRQPIRVVLQRVFSDQTECKEDENPSGHSHSVRMAS